MADEQSRASERWLILSAAARYVGVHPSTLHDWAERKEDPFFAQRGWRDARDFLRQLPRLSTVVWWDAWDAPTGGAWTLWQNPQAKHPLPHEARNALRR